MSLSLTKPNGLIIIPQNIAMYAGVRTAIAMAAGVAPAMIRATVFRIVPPWTAALMANIMYNLNTSVKENSVQYYKVY